MNSQDLLTLCGAVAFFCGPPLILSLLIYFKFRDYRLKQNKLKELESKFGKEMIDLVRQGKIAPGMTKELVHLSWGKPRLIDDIEVTASSRKERWVYGEPRKTAKYVSFDGEIVVKIKT